MSNKPKLPDASSKTYTFAPAITTIAFPILFGRGKKTESAAQEKTSKPTPKPKELAVEKYELSESVLKFFVAKGFPKKRWVAVKEIPVYEIASVESFGNELSVSWNGSVYSFVSKKKTESFSTLRDQIRNLLEDQQKTIETNEKANLQKSDLTAAINSSIDIVDLSFNILMGLSEKRVNWARLEGYVDSLGKGLSFKGQTMAPLNLDFAGVSAAIKKQTPKETSKETFNILKSIYAYFDGLKPNGEDTKPSFQQAKAAILAYYTLNDLMFAKVIGEGDTEKEALALESVLAGLANESNVKVPFEELKASVDMLGVEGENQGVVDDTRAIFKEQLRLL